MVRGIDRRQAPDQLQDGFVIDALNTRVASQAAIQSDLGLSALGAGGTLRGVPQLLATHTFNDGTTETLLVTTASFYKYASSPEQWKYIQGAAGTTLAAAASATDTYVDVADASGINDADYIGIELDDGTQHQTTVNGAPSIGGGAGGSDRVNVDDAIPSAASIGNAAVVAVVLAGSANLPACSVAWKPDDWFIFNNAVDEPQAYTGTSCADISGLSGISLTAAQWVTAIHNQIILFNTTEGGTDYPSRVRRCVIGDGTDWSTSATGAGYEDIPEPLGVGRRAEPLGDALALYFAKGVCLYELVNDGSALWRYRQTVVGDGLAAPLALLPRSGVHYLLSNRDVMAYTGGPIFLPIGAERLGEDSPVQEVVFSVTSTAGRDVLSRSFMLDHLALGEIWLVYPGVDGNINQVLRYNFNAQGWSRRELPGTYTNGLAIGRSTGLTWADMTGTWGGTQGSWGSFGKESLEMWLCKNASPGVVVAHTPIASDDLGAAISWLIELGEVRSPPWQLRVERLDFLASGDAFVVELSEDSGATWTTVGTVTPAGSFLARTRLDSNATVDAARIRISGTGATRIEWAALSYFIEGDVP